MVTVSFSLEEMGWALTSSKPGCWEGAYLILSKKLTKFNGKDESQSMACNWLRRSHIGVGFIVKQPALGVSAPFTSYEMLGKCPPTL